MKKYSHFNIFTSLFFKFKNLKISKHCKNMGVTDSFQQNLANFGDFGNVTGLFISKIMHSAFIDVNMEGTEAAAVTNNNLTTATPGSQFTVRFHCDRPFLFIIHDNINNTIFFMGKMVNPC